MSKRIRPRGFVARLVILVGVFVGSLADGAASLDLGNVSLATKRAVRPLATQMTIGTRFFRAVGGVAFSQKAVPADGFQVLDLDYDPSRPDGQRLVVTLLDGRAGIRVVVSGALYDWELGPIVRFAASDDDACFSLFGEPENPMEEIDDGERLLAYHPALSNTLVGLRAFQADVLVISEIAADLPKTKGRYVLGAGERAPDSAANHGRYLDVRDWLREQDETFASYVICDEGRTITFGAAADRLALTGTPVWLCWTNSEVFQAAMAREEELLLRRVFRRAMEMLTPGQAVAVELGMSSDNELVVERAYATLEPLMLRALEEMDPAEVERRMTSAVPESEQTRIQRELSAALTSRVEAADGINPTVYAALVRLMQYAAFFRHVRAEAPREFRELAAEVSRVPSGLPGRIRTPTSVVLPLDQDDREVIEDLEALLGRAGTGR